MREREIRRLRPQSVGDRAVAVFDRPVHAVPSGQPFGGVRGELRLHPEDLRLRAQRPDRDADARRQSAAADRDEDVSHRRQVVGDLQADRALPGDDIGMVERRNQHTAGLGHDAGRDALPLPRRAQHDVRSVFAGGMHLDVRCLLGHHDVGGQAEGGRRVGDRLGVVAARVRDDGRRRPAGGLRTGDAASALKAPRTLNAPMGCRFSGLTHSGRSSSPHRAASSGVRTTWGLIRSAAARMSSIVTSFMAQVVVAYRSRAPPAGIAFHAGVSRSFATGMQFRRD